jgi:hypothetical protein
MNTSEVRFFGEDAIPAALSGERTRSRHILDAFAVYRDRERSTFFD